MNKNRWMGLVGLLAAAMMAAPMMISSYHLAAAPSAAPTAGRLTDDQIATLNSLKQVDDYPLYTMNYYGSWDDLSEVTASTGTTPFACSLFAALADPDARIYGRNFDWQYSPALLLFTYPDEGYNSVSMVDIAYLGLGRGAADLPLEARTPLLYAPTLPFDGLNERGLAVGMAAVDQVGEMPNDPSRETIDSLGIIREVLDHAATVDEAVAIFEDYNIEWGGGPPIHYLIADASGKSVLIEFYAGEMSVMPGETSWQAATNFLNTPVQDDPAQMCARYDHIHDVLTEREGQLTLGSAMTLLSEVAQPGSTQWSIVYGMSTGEVQVVMHGAYDHVYTFELALEQ